MNIRSISFALVVGMLTSAGCLFLLGSCGGEGTSDAPDFETADRVAYGTSIILVEAKPRRKPAEARARIWRLWHMINDGTSFATVAGQNSDDESRNQGGFVGFVPVGPDNAQSGAMQALAPGMMSRPVRTLLGFQIFYRHSFDEAVRLEREKGIWIFGAYIRWGQDTGRSKEQAKDLAERVLAQLKTGDVSLPDVVQKYGQGTRVPLNGYLGHTYNRAGRKALFDPLSKVAEGEFVGPVDTQLGWAVLQRGRSLRALVRHILIQDHRSDLSIRRSAQQAKALAEKLLQELQADPSKWDRHVTNHSDDVGTRARMGLLPTITPGAWDERFEAIVRETAPGTLAARVVESEHGWHIVKRLK